MFGIKRPSQTVILYFFLSKLHIFTKTLAPFYFPSALDRAYMSKFWQVELDSSCQSAEQRSLILRNDDAHQHAQHSLRIL